MALKTKEQLKAGFVANLNEYNNATIGDDSSPSEKKKSIPEQKEKKATRSTAKKNEKKESSKITESDTAKKTVSTSKVGRPKGEEVKHVSVAVPVRMLEQMNKASLTHRGNTTAYIISLIEEDLKKNGSRYDEAAKLLGH